MSKGTPWAAILFVVFLVLKLTGNIDWSWWWVTSPLWIAGGIIVVLLGIAAGAFALSERSYARKSKFWYAEKR